MTPANEKLTEGSILNHLIRLSIPASMGMIFNTLYNLTDYWFAGMLSDDALAGMSIAGSVFFLLLSIGVGVQTGTSAVIAPEVGRDKLDDVGLWRDNSVGVSIFLSIIIMILGWFIADPLVRLLGAEPHIAPLSLEYLNVTLVGSIAFILSFAAAGALMALGDTTSNRNALAVGFFANFALNPLLTFTFGLGVAGLALATVLIKTATAIYLFYVLGKRLGVSMKPAIDWQRWLALFQQILPASFNMLTMILGGFITVAIIGRFGSEHVAGYAVGLRLEQVLLLPALGLNTAVMAIAGQNFGAGLIERVNETYSKGLAVGFVMALISIPIMIFFSPSMMRFFTDNDTIIATGSTYLRIDALAFYAFVVLFLSVATLQALKEPLFPMVLGIARQLILPVTINYLLIVVWEFQMVSMFYSIVSVALGSAVLAHWYTRKRILQLMKS